MLMQDQYYSQQNYQQNQYYCQQSYQQPQTYQYQQPYQYCNTVVQQENKKIKRGTLLKDSDPDVYNQIHPTLNPGLIKETITYASNKKIWWLCDTKHCGCHEWETIVFHRSRSSDRPSGCPFCNRSKKCKHSNFNILNENRSLKNDHSFDTARSFGTGNYWFEIDLVAQSIVNIIYSFDDIKNRHPFFDLKRVSECINDPKKSAYNHAWINVEDSKFISLSEYMKLHPFSDRLIDLYPQVYSEIDWTKQTEDVSMCTYASEVKVWFKCKNPNHVSYISCIKPRTIDEGGCKECYFDRKANYDRQGAKEHIKNYIPNLSTNIKGEEKEKYVYNIIKQFVTEGFFKNVEVTGNTNEKADLKVTLNDGTMKSLQVKTLIKDNGNEAYFVSYCNYHDQMMVVMINNDYNRFGIVYASMLSKTVSTSFNFDNWNNKGGFLTKDLLSFKEQLKICIPYSCDYELIASPLHMKEIKMFERLKFFVESHGSTFRRNDSNANDVDLFINDIPYQAKYSSSMSSDITYVIGSAKSAGFFQGKQISQPYRSDDKFEYFIIELGGPSGDIEKYHGNFCIIPKQELANQGILRVEGKCDGHKSFVICIPDFQGDHWSKRYWMGPLANKN